MQLSWKGEQQEGRVGKPLEPFEVLVRDEEGLAAQLVPVEFKLLQGQGEFSYKDEHTDLGGNVIAEFIPSADGWYRVECFIGEGDDRKMVPFKGNIKPDRRKKGGTVHGISDTWVSPEPAAQPHQPTVIPLAAVPPPLPPVEQASPPAPPPVPVVQVTVAVQPQAAPIAAPEVVRVPPTPPPPAPAATAVPKPKPAPKPAPVQAPRRPQPKAVAATAVLPRPAPKPAQQPRIEVRHAPKARRPAKPAVSPGLIIGLVILYALLIGLLGVLAVRTSNPPRTAAIECTSDAWVVTGNSLTFRRCMATLR